VRRLAFAAAVAGLLLAEPSSAAPPATACFAYEPVVSMVMGTITITPFYGAPGFGKTPRRDAKLHHPILKLDKPACVDAKKGNAYNSRSETGIESMQLVFASYPFGAEWHGRHVAVTGRLFHGFTADHRTKVLVMVQQVRATNEGEP
jgi:hypothetical protein